MGSSVTGGGGDRAATLAPAEDTVSVSSAQGVLDADIYVL